MEEAKEEEERAAAAAKRAGARVVTEEVEEEEVKAVGVGLVVEGEVRNPRGGTARQNIPQTAGVSCARRSAEAPLPPPPPPP